MDCEKLENAIDVTELKLCDVKLDNDIRLQRMFLILKDTKIKKFSDLSPNDMALLMYEVALCEKALLSRHKDHLSKISMKYDKKSGKFIISITLQSRKFIGVLTSSKGYQRPYSEMKLLSEALKNKIFAIE